MPELLDSEAFVPPKLHERLVDKIQNIPRFQKVGYLLLIISIDILIIYNVSPKFFPWIEILKLYAAIFFSLSIYGYTLFILIRGCSLFMRKLFSIQLKINELDAISIIFSLALFTLFILFIYSIYYILQS